MSEFCDDYSRTILAINPRQIEAVEDVTVASSRHPILRVAEVVAADATR